MTDSGENDGAEAPGVDLVELVKDLRGQVGALEEDLLARSDEVDKFASELHEEYARARQAKRTAATYGAWRDQRVTQAAAAWVLGTVFVRFCEDNELIEWPFIAGPGERLADAEEQHEAFFREHPKLNDRDWLTAAFDHLSAAHPTVAGLFDQRHNPLWKLTPSFEAASALLAFWRRREHRYDFTGMDTRFLGDLYQDLSEDARKTYALLQTPVFVEEFILDLTLEPAVKEFGLTGLRTIDPACGSGHFLLGIFARLLAKWRAAEPGTDRWVLIRRSLESVHGCDKNPFAVSIARFRLLVAALQAAGEKRLSGAPEFPINIAIGDSLLHGRGAPVWAQEELFSREEPHTYHTEDVPEFAKSCDLLGRGSYHVVVGNPPYITPKDKREKENYREGYDACSGLYALSVPFAQCLFQLAIRTNGSDRDAGYVGQITANSFMKREFGKKLIEKFFPTRHLTHVIDTSGAYIPGHGTPTAILIGRNHIGREDDSIRAILGVRGEPSQPEDASKGLVWTAIVKQIHESGSESDWITIADMARSWLARYPWSLSGGGAADLMTFVQGKSSNQISEKTSSIGFCAATREDDVYIIGTSTAKRLDVSDSNIKPIITGTDIRDWVLEKRNDAIFPYNDQDCKPSIDKPTENFRLY